MNNIRIYLYYFRDVVKRYNVGRTFEKLGLHMQLNGADTVPALRKMFFNCMRIYTEGGAYTFNGSECGFTHSEFVKLYKFATENGRELSEMLDLNGANRNTYKWTQNPPKYCFFRNGFKGYNKTRMYRRGGSNTYYLQDGALHSAKGLILSREVTRRMCMCSSCNVYVIEHYENMIQAGGYKYCTPCAENLNTCISCEELTHGKKCNTC